MIIFGALSHSYSFIASIWTQLTRSDAGGGVLGYCVNAV